MQYIRDEENNLQRDIRHVCTRWATWFHTLLNTTPPNLVPAVIDNIEVCDLHGGHWEVYPRWPRRQKQCGPYGKQENGRSRQTPRRTSGAHPRQQGRQGVLKRFHKNRRCRQEGRRRSREMQRRQCEKAAQKYQGSNRVRCITEALCRGFAGLGRDPRGSYQLLAFTLSLLLTYAKTNVPRVSWTSLVAKCLYIRQPQFSYHRRV